MASRDQFRQELRRFFTFPVGRPTDADLDLIAADVMRANTTNQSDVERIVVARIPQTRVHRFDGLTFQDIGALLAIIRAQAQAQSKK